MRKNYRVYKEDFDIFVKMYDKDDDFFTFKEYYTRDNRNCDYIILCRNLELYSKNKRYDWTYCNLSEYNYDKDCYCCETPCLNILDFKKMLRKVKIKSLVNEE